MKQKLYYSEPKDIDALNRYFADREDDERGGMVLITICVFWLLGALIGGLVMWWLL